MPRCDGYAGRSVRAGSVTVPLLPESRPPQTGSTHRLSGRLLLVLSSALGQQGGAVAAITWARCTDLATPRHFPAARRLSRFGPRATLGSEFAGEGRGPA